jgi:hypothetical protein
LAFGICARYGVKEGASVLTVDTNEHFIGPDHQLPEHASEPHRHKFVRIILWLLVPLLLLLAFLMVMHHREAAAAKKKAAPGPPKITITTATAQ